MKMLLLKIPQNVAEVMVVLMVLLLALKLVQSGVRHKKGGGLDRISKVCWEKGGDLFQEGLQFLCKK